MHLDMLLGSDGTFTGIMTDLLRSLLPLADQHDISLHELGDLDSLSERVQNEIAAANTVVSVVPLVSAWSRKNGLRGVVRVPGVNCSMPRSW